MRELTTRLVPLGELEPHPDNPNSGDVAAVRELLRRYGQWRPVVAQVRPEGRLRVLIGHTMLRAAQAEGWQRIAVHERHDTDDDALRILAADNHARDLAHTDEAALVRLLDSLGDDLAGTTYAVDDLDNLRALVEEQNAATLRAVREAGDGDRPPPQVRTTAGHGDLLDRYTAQGTRHLALAYPVAVFVWLVDALDRVRTDLGVDSNVEAVLRLVERAVDDTAPPLDAPAGPPPPLRLVDGSADTLDA